jgi:ribosomal protein L11 methylase PrmA
MSSTTRQHPASYRDPSGYVFTHNGQIYRQVNQPYRTHFDKAVSSGLYQALMDDGLLIPHEAIAENLTGDDNWYTTLRPQPLDLISYPYEWSFSQLKQAALLTLTLALKALERGMILKDATAYNVQLHKGRCVFIDTLSFETYNEGQPWIAYRQFCEHFVAPLALMHYTSLPLQRLMLAYPEGIPLAYAKALLPYRSRFNIHLFLHLHLHAGAAGKNTAKNKAPHLPKEKLVNLLKGLQVLVQSMNLKGSANVWGDYYEEAETRGAYLHEKKAIISGWLAKLDAQTVIDIGGNTGEFSLLAATGRQRVICADGEHAAVERLYKKICAENIPNIYPLCIDFTNPSPAIGVNNEERSPLFQRASSDLAMALALIHHLCVGRNIPFALVAEMCARLGRQLIIEFVPKNDEKVQVLLQHRKDIYEWYTEEMFETGFAQRFRIVDKQRLPSSLRTLYLMERL